MVVDIDEQREVDGLGQPRIVERGLHHAHIGEALALRALAEMLHHVGLDVGGVDRRLRQHAREAHGEVARARADVGDHRIGLERERVDHLMRLLPGVAARIVEDRRPARGVAELVLVRRRRLGADAACKRGDSQQDEGWC